MLIKRNRSALKYLLLLFFVTISFGIFAVNVNAAQTGDTFTDSAGVLLENHTSDSGHTWAKQSGTGASVIITSENRAYRSTTGSVIYYSSWIPTSADYDVAADLYITNIQGNFGVGGRTGTGSFTGYYALFNGNVLSLYKGGNGTPLATSSVSTNSGDTHNLRLEMRGNRIKVYWDNAVAIDVTATGGNIISSTGRASLYVESSVVYGDNFVAADSGTVTAGLISELSHGTSTASLSWTRSHLINV